MRRMRLVDFAIQYPVSVTVGVLMVVLFGVVSLFRLPIQLTPNVEKPEITVETRWPGGSPQEVEREIVDEQEKQLKNVDGLEKMTSESTDGEATITLEFPAGTNIDSSLLKVSNRLNQVQEYPIDADEPIIYNVNPRANAMGWFIFRPLEHNPINIYTQRDFAEDFIKPRFERVSGVATSNVFGGQDRELQVIVDPAKLAARQITLLEMGQVLDRENQNISAGDFDDGKRRYLVRTIGEYTSPKDIENIIITSRNRRPVYVRDVAEIQLGYRDADFVVRQKGFPAIAINAQRATGANVLDTMAGLKKAVRELNEGILKERGFQLYQVYDETDYVKSSLTLVQKNLVIGGLLAVFTLWIFLRNWSSTLVIAVAIPISVIGTFIFLQLLGRNLNVVSLAGMTFAAGMVVDNAVVVLENIYRHREMGKSKTQAAYDGTVEVWGAVLASTLTTMAVFIPILFIEEQAGQLFRDIALAIAGGVGLSLIVAITVIPSLSSKILRANGPSQKDKNHEKDSTPADRKGYLNPYRLSGGFRDWLANTTFLISGSVLHRLGIVILLTSLSLAGAWLLIPKAEYLPEGNRNLIFGMLFPPPGYNLDELTQMGKVIEGNLRPYWEAESNSPEARELGAPRITNFFYVARGRMVFMGAIADDPLRVKELIPVMQKAISILPGTFGIITQPSLFSRGIAGGRSIDVEITGPRLEELVGLGGQLFGQIAQLIPGSQIRPIPSLDLGNPEIQVTPDRERGADLNLSNQELGFMVNVLVDGVRVSDYKHEGEEIDLTLRGKDVYSNRIQDLEQLPIYTPGGKLVTLGSVADIRLVTGPEQVNHIERERAITLQVIPPEQLPLEKAMEMIQKDIVAPMVESGQFGGLNRVTLAGTVDDLTKTFHAFKWNFLLALLITYLLMASLFESFLYPFVIMFSVPLSIVGGFLGLHAVNTFTYQPMDVLTMLGFVILIGIVVNNAILLVHQSLNNIRNHQLPLREAIRESVRSRVRPIFMSVLTTLFGLSPLVIFSGSGSELYRGIGSVVLGGLLVSTIFTLFVVPALFSLLLEGKEKLLQLEHITGADQKEVMESAPGRLLAFWKKLNGVK